MLNCMRPTTYETPKEGFKTKELYKWFTVIYN